MEKKETPPHIVSYRTYALVLAILLLLTGMALGLTRIDLGPYSVAAILSISCIEALLLLTIFMHLKFDKKFYAIMVGAIFLLLAAVIIITFIDYLYR